MTSDTPIAPGGEPAADAAELARLGIIRVPSEHYLVGPYRYAKLSEAIAEAKRVPIAENDR